MNKLIISFLLLLIACRSHEDYVVVSKTRINNGTYQGHGYYSDACYLNIKADTIPYGSFITNGDTDYTYKEIGAYQINNESIQCYCFQFDDWKIGDRIQHFQNQKAIK